MDLRDNKHLVDTWMCMYVYVYAHASNTLFYISLNSIHFYLYLCNSTHSSTALSYNSFSSIYDKTLDSMFAHFYSEYLKKELKLNFTGIMFSLIKCLFKIWIIQIFVNNFSTFTILKEFNIYSFSLYFYNISVSWPLT